MRWQPLDGAGLTPCPHLRRDWARPTHICTGTGRTPAISAPGPPLPTSAPGLGSPLTHLHRDQAHPCPHLLWDWARPCHICSGTGLAANTSAPTGLTAATSTTGLARPSATPAPGPGLSRPHLRRDWAHHTVRAAAQPARTVCTARRATTARPQALRRSNRATEAVGAAEALVAKAATAAAPLVALAFAKRDAGRALDAVEMEAVTAAPQPRNHNTTETHPPWAGEEKGYCSPPRTRARPALASLPRKAHTSLRRCVRAYGTHTLGRAQRTRGRTGRDGTGRGGRATSALKPKTKPLRLLCGLCFGRRVSGRSSTQRRRGRTWRRSRPGPPKARPRQPALVKVLRPHVYARARAPRVVFVCVRASVWACVCVRACVCVCVCACAVLSFVRG